jgi:hypothetical protein
LFNILLIKIMSIGLSKYVLIKISSSSCNIEKRSSGFINKLNNNINKKNNIKNSN